MSVPVRSATELAETIKYCSGLLADCAEEDGVRADILAATAALVALAERAEEGVPPDVHPEAWARSNRIIRDRASRAEAAEARVAELETALREITNLSSQDVPFTAAEGSAGVMRKIARRALLAAGSPTGQQPEVCDDCRGTGQHIQHGGAWTCQTCKGTGLSPTGQEQQA